MLLEVKLDELVGGDVLAGVTSSAAVCVLRDFFHTNLNHLRSYVEFFVRGAPLSLLLFRQSHTRSSRGGVNLKKIGKDL